MEYKIAVLAAFLFFGTIIIGTSIYGLKTWINLESEKNLFRELIKKHTAVIFPVLSLVFVTILLITIYYLFGEQLLSLQ